MSQPPEHPGSPNDPWGGNPNPRRLSAARLRPSSRTTARLRTTAGTAARLRTAPGVRRAPAAPRLWTARRYRRSRVRTAQPGYGPRPATPAARLRTAARLPGASGLPPPPGRPFNIGDAFSWAWNKFSKNIGPLILATLVYGVIGAGRARAGVRVAGRRHGRHHRRQTADYGASFRRAWAPAGRWCLSIVSFVFGIFVQAAFLSGGARPRRRQAGKRRFVLQAAQLRQRDPGRRAAQRDQRGPGSASLLPGFVFALLSFVAILVFTFFALFTIAFATDRGLPPIDALKASVTTVRSHIGETLLSSWFRACWCCWAFWPAASASSWPAPVALLIQVYTYRRLSGGPVAPLTP